MNKKADIPTTLLFVVAVVLSLTTLFIFLSAGSTFKGQSEQISKVIGIMELSQKYILSEAKSSLINTVSCPDKSNEFCAVTDIKERFTKISSSSDFILPGTESYLGKIRREEFSLTQAGDIYILQVENITLTSQISQNKLTRTLSICLQYNITESSTHECIIQG